MRELEEEDGSIEGLLRQGKRIQFSPRGYSMYPVFVPGRDEAVVAPVTDSSRLRRGDVALFRRDSGMLVLHRIWKRKEDGFYLVGDNQKEIEGPLRPEQMLGVLEELVRDGKRISVKNPIYRLLTHGWLLLRPFRPWISKAAAKIKSLALRCREILARFCKK